MKTECPRCGEIEFTVGQSGAGYCKNCHHYEQLNHWWAQQDQDDEWIEEMCRGD